jgi:ESF2/ABP1 family protein
VEFSDKSVAKNVAASLNLTPISRKKGDYYHDDLWNLKYLKGFKYAAYMLP